MSAPNASDILVLLSHPWMTEYVPLETWIALGPPTGRPFVAPFKAKSLATGKELPLDVIPIAYRNDQESWRMIRAGKLNNPWPNRGVDDPASGRT